MMKFVYIAHVGLYDDWAQTVQIVKMCEAFAYAGVDITLVVPRRKIENKNDPFAYLGIKKNFNIVEIPHIDVFRGSTHVILYWVRFFSFLVCSRMYLLCMKYDVVYTREMYAVPFFHRVYLERHSLPKVVSKFHTWIFNRVSGLIVLTSYIQSRLVSAGISADKIFVAHDAVRLEDFATNISTEQAREKLGLPQGVHLFGYAGTLKTMGQEKGVATGIESLKMLPADYIFYVVGGEKIDVEFYKKYAEKCGVAERVIFRGKVPHVDMPLHIAACDCVVAPFPNIEHYAYFMSPLKIFEYMASRKPMIVTDLPSLREVLTDQVTALFIPPSDPKALALSIERLCTDSNLAHHIAHNAHKDAVEKYTWKKRAERIVKFITQ